MKQENNLRSYTLLSILGAVQITLLVLTASSEARTVAFFDKLILTAIFISSCLFGISFAIKPNWIGRFTKQVDHDLYHGSSQVVRKRRRGHHPDCKEFHEHVIKSKSRIRCAGCTGLAIGSLISIFFAILYLSFLDKVSSMILYLFIILGVILITLNYLEIIYSKRKAFIHLILNIFLVCGFFLVIIGIFQLIGSLLYGIFAVVISILWMDTRIQFSKWRHGNICGNCSETCKVYLT